MTVGVRLLMKWRLKWLGIICNGRRTTDWTVQRTRATKNSNVKCYSQQIIKKTKQNWILASTYIISRINRKQREKQKKKRREREKAIRNRWSTSFEWQKETKERRDENCFIGKQRQAEANKISKRVNRPKNQNEIGDWRICSFQFLSRASMNWIDLKREKQRSFSWNRNIYAPHNNCQRLVL